MDFHSTKKFGVFAMKSHLREADSLALASMLFLIPTGVSAAEAECSNVKDSAVTHYMASSTASVTESGQDCTISIDGANAASSLPDTIALVSRCVSLLGLERILFDTGTEAMVFAETIIPLLAGASVPGFALQSNLPSVDGFPDVGLCYNIFSSLDQHSFGSRLHAQVRSGIAYDIEDCLTGGSGGAGVQCDVVDNQLRIGFSTSFGAHALFLPR